MKFLDERWIQNVPGRLPTISPQVHSPPSPPDIGADPLFILSPVTNSLDKQEFLQCSMGVVVLGSHGQGQHSGGRV